MFVRNPPGTLWPSEEQKLLLRAALAEQSAAVEAWQELRPRISLDELEFGSFELLPLIYKNLSEAGHDDVDLPRLKGVYRRTWVKNNLLMERTKATSEALAHGQTRAEFVEGTVLASRFYDELGLRPTSLLDVLVGARDGPMALAALSRAGWAERRDASPGNEGLRYLFDEDGNVCALRTTLAGDLTRSTADAPPGTWLWGTGELHHVGDFDIPVPPPTETLFAVCVLHARVTANRKVQWMVDAKMVLQAEIDWQRLVALAHETGQVSRLRDALDFLAFLPGTSPPQDTRDHLAAIPVSRRQRISYLCTVGGIRGLGGAPALVGEHLAATADRSPLGVVAAFPRFLRDRWNLSRTWHIPLSAGKRAARLIAQRGRAA